MREHVKNVIVNLLRNPLHEAHTDLFLGEATPIWGESSSLDSMGLVSFIVEIENELEYLCGFPVTLANPKAFSLRHSPFATVGSLTDYATALIMENQHV